MRFGVNAKNQFFEDCRNFILIKKIEKHFFSKENYFFGGDTIFGGEIFFGGGDTFVQNSICYKKVLSETFHKNALMSTY